RDLALAVGYTEAHVCRLEKNYRPPDETTIAALFVPALELEREPAWAERLLQLTTEARRRNPAGAPRPPPTPQVALPTNGGIPAAPAYHVARPALLEKLHRHLAAERRVALTGLAGMGKSTLAAAYARQAAGEQSVFWLTLTSGITTPVEAITRHLATFLLAQGVDQVRPLLSLAADKGASLSFDQQVALLAAALTSRPALLCFDDVHLVGQDDTTLGLFRHLMAATPATLLFTSREEVPLAGVPHVRLAGLEEAEALALLDQLGSRLAPELAHRLLAKTGHSPMLLRLAAGRLLHGQAEEPAAFIDRLETHPQVSSYVLDTVLNYLRPDSRALVEWLAIFRQPVDLYDDSLVDRVRQAAAIHDMPAALAELQRRQLIHHPAQADLHPLVRDHVRATLALSAPWKRQLHQAAAEWWETSQDNVVEAAYHTLQLNDLGQVVEILLDQGAWLFDQGQGPAALEVVDQALARLPQRPSLKNATLRRQLLTIRGELLAYTMRTTEAEENYRQALALATEPAVRAQVTVRLAEHLSIREQTDEVRRLCQAAIVTLSPSDTLLLAQLKNLQARVAYQTSDFDEAGRLSSESLALADQLPPALLYYGDQPRVKAYSLLSAIHRNRGNLPLAITCIQQALDVARRSGQKRLEYVSLVYLADLQTNTNLDIGLLLYEEAIEGLLAIGAVVNAARFESHAAYYFFLRGEQHKALEKMEQTGQLLQQLGNLMDWAINESMRVNVLLSLNRLAEARHVIERVLQSTESFSQSRQHGFRLRKLAMIQMLEGDFAGAQATLSSALALPGVYDVPSMYIELQRDLALALLLQGEFEAAEAWLARSLPPAGIQPEVEIEWNLTKAAVALAQGHKPDVADAVAAVLERTQATGRQLEAVRARRLLAASDTPPPAAAIPWLLWVDVPTDQWGPAANELPHLST
ncbi:MAG: hypothetical protein L0332_32840, partial [Chloroflexi bacterium]|nr:hypothetical protein [Chloroflexota bacterium]MCI0646794.1 hypothetical protein [Chloroflexota bacterium]MCI0731491.1 hypothetical protein [Chloroflexota bacterium]